MCGLRIDGVLVCVLLTVVCGVNLHFHGFTPYFHRCTHRFPVGVESCPFHPGGEYPPDGDGGCGERVESEQALRARVGVALVPVLVVVRRLLARGLICRR